MDENTQASLKERKRTLINGNYGPDYDMGRRPECMALFQNKNAAVIINGMLTVYSPSQSVMEIRFALENPKEEDGSFYVEFSRDGKQWQRSEQGKYRLKMGLLSFMRIMKTGIPRSIIVSAFKKTGGTIIRIL